MGWLPRSTRGTGVEPAEVNDLARRGAVVLDVRETSEWDDGHAPGARHVPIGSLGGQLDSLPRDRVLVVVCRSGHRSARATAVLRRSGFDAVNLDGGMQAWAAAGLPVASTDGRPGTVA